MLTRAERLALWNQYEILKTLHPEDKESYEEWRIKTPTVAKDH
jgi:uncharacterized protein YfbU (UPF0304 family)